MLVSSLILLAAAQSAESGQATQIPENVIVQGCNTAGHAQFDFWVGEWDVYPKDKEDQAAYSRVERLYGGCAIRENWMPFSGPGGGSLNSFDPATGRWHQKWVGTAPGMVEFEGNLAAPNKMVLTGFWQNFGGPARHALVRMSFSLQEDGTVRQHGEASADGGLNWQTSFDLIYKKRSKPIPKKKRKKQAKK